MDNNSVNICTSTHKEISQRSHPSMCVSAESGADSDPVLPTSTGWCCWHCSVSPLRGPAVSNSTLLRAGGASSPRLHWGRAAAAHAQYTVPDSVFIGVGLSEGWGFLRVQQTASWREESVTITCHIFANSVVLRYVIIKYLYKYYVLPVRRGVHRFFRRMSLDNH